MNFNLAAILEALEGVDFILVGGIAAVVQGVPIVTQDVDILYKIEPGNLQRLLRTLEKLDAVVRYDPRRLRFNVSHLSNKGHKLTETNQGPLDVLGSINEEQLLYADLLPHADVMDFGTFEVRVLRLDKLIELKRQLGRPKDLAMLPILEATLTERNR